MNADIGNANAIEVIDGVVIDVEGEQVTSFLFPDGTSVIDAAQAVIATMPVHMAEGWTPPWIQCSDGGLQSILAAHFGLSSDSTRPANWGLPKTLKAPKTTKNVTPAPADNQDGEV